MLLFHKRKPISTNHLEQNSNGSTKRDIAIAYLRPFLPRVVIAGLSTTGHREVTHPFGTIFRRDV
jgi:hypothetical protein